VRRFLLLLVVAGSLWGAPGAFAAGWCGAGESVTDARDAVTGRQVHAVYAVPSDGADGFATVAPKLADDVASITAWWQGQDPTHLPRFDQAVFPAGTCLDISFVRVSDPASAFSSAGAAFQRLASDLFAAGLNNPFKKYVVYYDGPSVQQDICGTGGGDFFAGPSYSVVWLAGCPGVPNDGIAAHELLHAFGALPDGAPHACPGDPGHPCDSTADILYPYTSGQPLSQELLDVGHDDYYGHSGTWLDIQDSLWLHLVAATEIPVAVSIGGAGSVSSDVPGVFCTASCTTEWDSGSTFTLDPIPSSSSRFVGWSGACSGRLACAVDAASATAVTARFGPLRIPVAVRTAGKGTVRCTPRCGKTIAGGAALTLRAVAAKGWKFAGWSGDCAAARGPTCRPKTDYHVTARATFRRR
jgi:hypothetical protein